MNRAIFVVGFGLLCAIGAEAGGVVGWLVVVGMGVWAGVFLPALIRHDR